MINVKRESRTVEISSDTTVTALKAMIAQIAPHATGDDDKTVYTVVDIEVAPAPNTADKVKEGLISGITKAHGFISGLQKRK